ncbi:MAG TPA: response regulator transcription factor [Candidatus Angelobacter sp.]|nr:response regulator transcription factor [Candidatus Angelobacter sp.]
MRLLLIEDNERLAAAVAEHLKAAGFAVDRVGLAAEAPAALAAARYDAVVLDLGLPDGDGMKILESARSRGDGTPILILTARDGLEDRISGLNAGADDYLLKPFAMGELVARLKALLRRPGAALGSMLEAGNLSLDTVNRAVEVAGRPLLLGRRELALLELLLRRAGRVVAKGALEEGLYGFDEPASANSVETQMSRLRKKLEAAGVTVAIHTVRGVGYLLTERRPTS